MNTIRSAINDLLLSIGIRRHTYGIDSQFRILDRRDNIADIEHVDWSIKHGGFETLYTGKGERVGVLDSGFDIEHKDLIGSINASCFIEGCPDSPSYFDNIGHGTFCAGEIISRQDGEGIRGVAYEATCFGGKVLYGDGRDRSLDAFERALVAGINACIQEGCGVISMSLGSNHKDPRIAEALAYAVDSGVIPFAAAGNEGMDGSPYASYPASFEDCISIAAADQNDMAQWFSTEGFGGKHEEQPEFAIASLEYYWGVIPGGYGKMTGTSMACPMAAGVALLWRQAMKEKGLLGSGRDVINQFRAWVKRVANDTNKNGWDPAIGYGVLLLDEDDSMA